MVGQLDDALNQMKNNYKSKSEFLQSFQNTKSIAAAEGTKTLLCDKNKDSSNVGSHIQYNTV